MLWSDVRGTFASAAGAVAALLDEVDAWDAPALGEWDVAALAGHVLRQVDAPARYLAEPAPTGPPLAGPAGYFAAYLAARTEDPAAMDAAVAARGAVDGADLITDGARTRFEEVLARSLAAVDAAGPERLVATPFGAMRLADYVRTRTFEVVVHGLDLTHAIGVYWEPPAAGTADALALTAELAAVTGAGPSLLALATGRTWVAAADVFPLLR